MAVVARSQEVPGVQEFIDLWVRRIVTVAAPGLGKSLAALLGWIKKEEDRRAVCNHAQGGECTGKMQQERQHEEDD
ncbi:hypothetical protein PA08_2581 [Cutibacterium modestum P08]|nr:hypothetical protein PA08_2581 [Cutibacterium modestum P08]